MYREYIAVMPNGMVAIVLEQSQFATPEVVVSPYPTGVWTTDNNGLKQYIADMEKKEVYRIASGAYFDSCNKRWSLTDGGATTPMAEYYVIKSYPCPKVRAGIETYYAEGKWWKRLKDGRHQLYPDFPNHYPL